jgi:hypothetical protein
MDIQSWAEKVAALGVDMLVDSGLIKNEDVNKAKAIVAQEIQIRLAMGDYPPSDETACHRP